GAAAGIKSVAAIRDQKSLGAYYLFYAVLAEFEIELKDFSAAAEHLRQAIQLTEIKSERALLEARLRDCEKESSKE
ncbi:MAG TPA: sigma factor, ECF subfamily protein, partial [Verrucomicrobiae bacterium]